MMRGTIPNQRVPWRARMLFRWPDRMPGLAGLVSTETSAHPFPYTIPYLYTLSNVLHVARYTRPDGRAKKRFMVMCVHVQIRKKSPLSQLFACSMYTLSVGVQPRSTNMPAARQTLPYRDIKMATREAFVKRKEKSRRNGS